MPREGDTTGGDVVVEVKDTVESRRLARSSAGVLPKPAPLLEPVWGRPSSKSMRERDSLLFGRSSDGIEAGGVSPRLYASYLARTLLSWSFVCRYVSRVKVSEIFTQWENVATK
jgi:hypothetical protein